MLVIILLKRIISNFIINYSLKHGMIQNSRIEGKCILQIFLIKVGYKFSNLKYVNERISENSQRHKK